LRDEGKKVWLYGGASVVNLFLNNELIDEYIIGVIPVLLEKGQLLFLGDNPFVGCT
jgi:dihydrofolate reductase